MSTKPENQIDYIELPASDIAGTKHFYSKVFGWKFEDYGPEYTSFHDGRLAGGFNARTEAPSKGLLLVLYCSDLEGAQQRIRDAGGKITVETFAFPGGRRFHFGDPNGNELAVWSERVHSRGTPMSTIVSPFSTGMVETMERMMPSAGELRTFRFFAK
jgi:predicted enzyme related to lactoylglutathione lyase